MNKNSFGEQFKLKKRSDFKALFEGKSETLHNKTYRILALKNSLDITRLGVVISKKTANAVHRNKQKRLVREIFRTNKSSIPIGYDVVVIVRNRKKIPHEKRENELLSLLTKIGISE